MDDRLRRELTVWDVNMLSMQYIQKGLLFSKPLGPLDITIQRLHTSISHCLLHFPFLTGRLATDPETTTFADCNNSGAQFIVATADGVYIQDLVSDADDPAIVSSFFPLDGAINYDGYYQPLLAVQETELVDGIFIGCSFNHAIGDGRSFWQFFNSWSELSSGSRSISRPTFTEHHLLRTGFLKFRFPVTENDVERPSMENLRWFTREAIAQLKVKANQQSKPDKSEISSFQALVALIWRLVTRARKLADHQTTSCVMPIDNRRRLEPPLSPDYFGNCIQVLVRKARVGELLTRELGWAAAALHDSVMGHTASVARAIVEGWVKKPRLKLPSEHDPDGINVASSPRYDMYVNDFGWGKGLAVLSGTANKYDGMIWAYPGRAWQCLALHIYLFWCTIRILAKDFSNPCYTSLGSSTRTMDFIVPFPHTCS